MKEEKKVRTCYLVLGKKCWNHKVANNMAVAAVCDLGPKSVDLDFTAGETHTHTNAHGADVSIQYV